MHLILFPSLADQGESLVVENTYIYMQTVWIPQVANIRHSVYLVGDSCSPHLSNALTDLQTQASSWSRPMALPASDPQNPGLSSSWLGPSGSS